MLSRLARLEAAQSGTKTAGGAQMHAGNGGPMIGRAGLVVMMKPEQLVRACAARGLSLERLGLEARISRPTLQAALRGQHVRPSTAFKIAQALSRFPVLAEMNDLLEAS